MKATRAFLVGLVLLGMAVIPGPGHAARSPGAGVFNGSVYRDCRYGCSWQVSGKLHGIMQAGGKVWTVRNAKGIGVLAPLYASFNWYIPTPHGTKVVICHGTSRFTTSFDYDAGPTNWIVAMACTLGAQDDYAHPFTMTMQLVQYGEGSTGPGGFPTLYHVSGTYQTLPLALTIGPGWPLPPGIG